MPAIEPARLKMQVEALMEVFHQPRLFGQAVDDLLSLYADRTQRPGQSEAGRNLLPAYNTPPPVLQTILIAARPLAEKEPKAALDCCDALWQFPALEPRLLAALLLRVLSGDESAGLEVLARLDGWCREIEDDGFRKRMIQEVFQRLGVGQPRLVLDHIKKNWEESNAPARKTALEMLAALVNNPGFENLPAVLTVAAQAIRNPDPRCKSQTLELMQAIVQRSPQEGAYVFSQAIRAGPNLDTRWLVRQMLQELPPNLSRELRNLAFPNIKEE